MPLHLTQIHNNTNKDMLGLPRVSRNWGKQRVCHHSLKDWNTLDNQTRNARNIAIFKRSVHIRFLHLSYFIALNVVSINFKFVLYIVFCNLR